jgi:predicted amidohydrolase YtcJ
LVVLDRDVLTISPAEMREAKVLWTIVAGKTVYGGNLPGSPSE